MSCYRRSTRIAQVERAGVFFVAGPGGDVVVLEDSAAVIWQCVDGSDIDDIVRSAASYFDLPSADIADAVGTFLETLREGELVTCD